MKKYLIIILIVVLTVVGVVLVTNKFKTKTSSNQTTTTTQEKKEQKSINDLFTGEIDVCQIFPQEEISKMLGKKITEVKNLYIPGSNFTEYHCTYYLDPKNALVIRVRQGNIKKIKEGEEMLGWKRRKESSIPSDNYVAYDVKNKLRQTEFIINEQKEIILDFWGVGGPVLDEKEAIKFSIDFANYLKDNFKF